MSRTVLTSSTTFYVRRDGNDGNDGLTDTPGGAFATGQGAISRLASMWDTGNSVATIQFSLEEHNTGISLRSVPGAGAVVFQGDVSNPRNCPLFVTNNFCVNNPGAQGVFIMQGFHLKTFGNAGYTLLRATEMGKLKYAHVEFGEATGCHLMAGRDGHLFSNGNNKVSGPAQCHYYAEQGGFVQEVVRDITFEGYPIFAQAFARAQQQGRIVVPANNWIGEMDMTTTKRYSVESDSYIGTNQSGPDYLPGGVAGTDDNGRGIYD